MAGTSWSSSSSCTSSLGSLDDDDVVCVVKPDSSSAAAAAAAEGSVKFLCSYGGRILPRHSDGALRYVGGDNRVLSVHRSLHFYELQRKLRDMCGSEGVSLRCQLPTEDLDALVSVTSDDDLAHLLEEYDAASQDRLQPLKIRAFLFPRTSTAATPPLSPSTPSSRPIPYVHHHHHHHMNRAVPQIMSSPPARAPVVPHHHAHGGESRPRHHHHGRYLLHRGSQLQ